VAADACRPTTRMGAFLGGCTRVRAASALRFRWSDGEAFFQNRTGWRIPLKPSARPPSARQGARSGGGHVKTRPEGREGSASGRAGPRGTQPFVTSPARRRGRWYGEACGGRPCEAFSCDCRSVTPASRSRRWSRRVRPARASIRPARRSTPGPSGPEALRPQRVALVRRPRGARTALAACEAPRGRVVVRAPAAAALGARRVGGAGAREEAAGAEAVARAPERTPGA
jgi:hypothetical protein